MAIGAGDVKTYNSILQEFEAGALLHPAMPWGVWRMVALLTASAFWYALLREQYISSPRRPSIVWESIYGRLPGRRTTTAGGYACTSTIRSIGILPGSEAMNLYEYASGSEVSRARYRFRTWTLTMIHATVIGQLEFRYLMG